MASPAQVANDLEAQAAVMTRQRRPDLAASFLRGAETIRAQMVVVTELEAAAQAEADRYDAYVSGDDLHG